VTCHKDNEQQSYRRLTQTS